MARVLHGMPIETLPDSGELSLEDQVVTYKADTGKACRSDIAGLGAAANQNISDAFSIVTKYSVGDYCIYNNTLYKCTTAHTGDWNEDDFKVVTVVDEILANQNDTSEAVSQMAERISTLEGERAHMVQNTTWSTTRIIKVTSYPTIIFTTHDSAVDLIYVYGANYMNNNGTGYTTSKISNGTVTLTRSSTMLAAAISLGDVTIS